MYFEKNTRNVAVSRNPEARETHEITYFKHVTGASEAAIQQAIKGVGNDRAKVERELLRRRMERR